MYVLKKKVGFCHKNNGLLTLFLQGLELFGSPCICAFSIELFGWGGGIICQKSLKIVINQGWTSQTLHRPKNITSLVTLLTTEGSDSGQVGPLKDLVWPAGGKFLGQAFSWPNPSLSYQFNTHNEIKTLQLYVVSLDNQPKIQQRHLVTHQLLKTKTYVQLCHSAQ